VRRLHDESLALFFVELVLEVVRILGQQPGFWEKRVLFFVDLHHSSQVLREVIFPSKYLNIRSCVNPLEGSNFADAITLNGDVAPVYVPVSILILYKLHVHLAGNAFYHIVSARLNAKH